MATREYCTNIVEELEVWSGRLHELSGKIDRVPSIDKYKLYPLIEELHIIMTEMDDRICDAMTSCSTVEGGYEEEGLGRTEGFNTRLNTDKNVLFDYDFGG
jgi:hypothetical protein